MLQKNCVSLKNKKNDLYFIKTSTLSNKMNLFPVKLRRRVKLIKNNKNHILQDES